MKVLYVSPYPPVRDGIGTYALALGGAVARTGDEVAVVAARRTPDARPECIAGLDAGAGAAIAAIRAFAPDVVHVQFAIAAYGARLPVLHRVLSAVRALGVPIVMTLHEVTRDTASLPVLGALVYRRFAGLATEAIVHTGPARARLRQIAPATRATIVAHPRVRLPAGAVDAPALRAQLGLGDARVLLAFGFLDVDKGLADLVAAAAIMRDHGTLRDALIVVAGEVRRREGPFRAFELRDRVALGRVQRAIADAGLGAAVRFTGFVPDEQVRGYLELATAVVLPYRRTEQSGVASLAAAAGTPVVATDVGELGALSVVPALAPRDPNALAAGLGRVLAEPRRSRERAVSDDLAEIARATVGVYRRAAGAPAPVSVPTLAPIA